MSKYKQCSRRGHCVPVGVAVPVVSAVSPEKIADDLVDLSWVSTFSPSQFDVEVRTVSTSGTLIGSRIVFGALRSADCTCTDVPGVVVFVGVRPRVGVTNGVFAWAAGFIW